MNRINIFSPFYTKQELYDDHLTIKNSYEDNIIKNYNESPQLSPDWQVHTSYNCENQLKHKLDWSIAKNIYSKYINSFLFDFFNKHIDWEYSGGLWYTAYGAGQTANIHEHIPDLFSFVHFLKFNPNVHWPVTFINPMGSTIKYLLDNDKSLKKNIDFNNQHQSLFHPRFTPMINEGDLICFPSYLEHMVEKSYDNELRITIAFNIKLK